MDEAGKYIEEDTPVMEGLKNELGDLIEPFQLCFVLYGVNVSGHIFIQYVSIWKIMWLKSSKNLVRESLSVVANIIPDCRYCCYRPVVLYQTVKCLAWLRQFSRDFSTNLKW